jgi:hypothetical protein
MASDTVLDGSEPGVDGVRISTPDPALELVVPVEFCGRLVAAEESLAVKSLTTGSTMHPSPDDFEGMREGGNKRISACSLAPALECSLVKGKISSSNTTSREM